MFINSINNIIKAWSIFISTTYITHIHAQLSNIYGTVLGIS